jgi:hypothetical protein
MDPQYSLRRSTFIDHHAVDAGDIGRHHGQTIGPSLVIAIIDGGKDIVLDFMNTSGIAWHVRPPD